MDQTTKRDIEMDSVDMFIEEKEYIQDLLAKEKSPCENCQNFESCKNAKLACLSFKAWVNEKGDYKDFSVIPTNGIYHSIYH